MLNLQPPAQATSSLNDMPTKYNPINPHSVKVQYHSFGVTDVLRPTSCHERMQSFDRSIFEQSYKMATVQILISQ